MNLEIKPEQVIGSLGMIVVGAILALIGERFILNQQQAGLQGNQLARLTEIAENIQDELNKVRDNQSAIIQSTSQVQTDVHGIKVQLADNVDEIERIWKRVNDLEDDVAGLD